VVLEGRRGERVRSPLFSQSSSNGRYPLVRTRAVSVYMGPGPPHDFSGNEPRSWLGGRAYRKIDGLDLARSEAREGVSVGRSLLYEVEAFSG